MFERTSDAIRYLCETTYHICQSGVMSTTLVVHYNTIPVKKQSTCHSGVMPTTLQQYLWRYNPHFTQVWCHPHYNNTCEDTTHMLLRCDATHTTTIPVKNNPHVTLVWLHPHYNNTCEEKSTCHSGVMPPTLQQYLWRTTHMSLWCDDTHTTTIPVKKHSTCHSGVMPPTLHTCDETTHMSLWCDDTHTTTIPVKKQSTCHSGVMPPTLHTCEETTHMSLWCDANHTTNYLWRNNPHVTSSGVTPPTLQQYLWRNIPQVTQVWCSWFWVSTTQKDIPSSLVCKNFTPKSSPQTQHLLCHKSTQYIRKKNLHFCDVQGSERYINRNIYLHQGVKTPRSLQQTQLVWHQFTEYHNMRRNNLHVTFVMFSTSNVTPSETYTFIPVSVDSQGLRHRHNNVCDIIPHNTTTVEGTIRILFQWCSGLRTLH